LTICTQKIIEIHDIEIKKSFRLLVLFGNGYKASTYKNYQHLFSTGPEGGRSWPEYDPRRVAVQPWQEPVHQHPAVRPLPRQAAAYR